MRKFLKNLFSFKNFSKKQITFVFLFFLISFLFFKVSPAYAQWYWLPERIASAFVGLILTVILYLAQAILNLGIIFLNWSLNGIPVSYTNPAGNELIRVGWTLIRDIANIGLILGLVYIALATALRFARFETKKVFPWLLIMALLVNFTPVICGVVVDAANIVMNFFLRGPGGWERLNSVFDEQRGFVLQYALGEPDWILYMKVAVLAAFGFISGMIFLLYGLLFLIRYVAIWLLVIFSPLAFVAYIFPATKKWFSMWWNQLLQWSFIGAIAGFFLYLAQYTLLLAFEGKIAIGGTPDNIFNELAPYFVAIIFLGIGFLLSTQTSAMGANVAIGAFKGATGAARKLSWKGAKAGAKWGGEKVKAGTKAGLHAIAHPVKTGKKIKKAAQVGGKWVKKAPGEMVKAIKAAPEKIRKGISPRAIRKGIVRARTYLESPAVQAKLKAGAGRVGNAFKAALWQWGKDPGILKATLDGAIKELKKTKLKPPAKTLEETVREEIEKQLKK